MFNSFGMVPGREPKDPGCVYDGFEGELTEVAYKKSATIWGQRTIQSPQKPMVPTV